MISTDNSTAEAPLYGLVLAGGRSRRMGVDKTALRYREGTPHARYTAGLLESFCERVFFSCRAEQNENPVFHGRPILPDRFPDWGPLGGILSAQWLYPQAAFFVVACDLPFLSAEPLRYLAQHRDPTAIATAFLNPERGHPEPLCAIYEPRFAVSALALAEAGCLCPTQILERLQAHLLPPPQIDFLENANRPEDYTRALEVLTREKAIHA